MGLGPHGSLGRSMTEEFSDPRPRRRLFGRRRPDEELSNTSYTSSAANSGEQSEPEPPDQIPESSAVEVNEVPTPQPAPAPPLPEPEPAPAPPVPTPEPSPVPQPEPEPAPPPSPEPFRAASPPVEAVQPVSEPVPVREPEPTPEPEPPLEPTPEVATPQVTTSEPEAADPAEAPDDEPVPLEIPRIIAIANQKGGVGKTTTAVNLGAALAESGLRVLVVDLDPQGNASTGLGINPRDVNASIYDVLMHDTPALDAVEPTSLKNLFVIPATLDLAGAEIELVPAFSRELKLKRALDTVRSEYDVVLIDCPPSLGLLTVNGLAAADDVIVPIQCEYYALEGLGQLLRNVALVRSSLNASLDVRGIILTMYDARTRLAEQVETEVREHFGSKVYKTVVPRTVRLAEAPSFGQPVIVFDSTSRGATAYRNLAKEVSGGATRRTG
jgi:chromosome partitioning protein